MGVHKEGTAGKEDRAGGKDAGSSFSPGDARRLEDALRKVAAEPAPAPERPKTVRIRFTHEVEFTLAPDRRETTQTLHLDPDLTSPRWAIGTTVETGYMIDGRKTHECLVFTLPSGHKTRVPLAHVSSVQE